MDLSEFGFIVNDALPKGTLVLISGPIVLDPRRSMAEALEDKLKRNEIVFVKNVSAESQP